MSLFSERRPRLSDSIAALRQGKKWESGLKKLRGSLDMNSCIYNAQIYHRRSEVRIHEFRTSLYTWYLDLDELSTIARRHPLLFGLNRWRVFSFRDEDHFRFWDDSRKEQAWKQYSQGLNAGPVSRGSGDPLPVEAQGAAEKRVHLSATSNPSKVRSFIDSYFLEKDLEKPHRILLLTNLRYLGYGFNPVSFYFAMDSADRLYAVLAEVNNTFGEQKPYLIVLDEPVASDENRRVFARAWKNFYVSPFIDRDREFVFRIKRPGQLLSLGVDTYSGEQPVLRAAYSGQREKIKARAMFLNMIRIPFVTFKVIALIHWHALLLFFKKVPYFNKDETDREILKDEHKRKEVTNATT